MANQQIEISESLNEYFWNYKSFCEATVVDARCSAVVMIDLLPRFLSENEIQNLGGYAVTGYTNKAHPQNKANENSSLWDDFPSLCLIVIFPKRKVYTIFQKMEVL